MNNGSKISQMGEWSFEYVCYVQSLIGKWSKTKWHTMEKVSEPTHFNEVLFNIYDQIKLRQNEAWQRREQGEAK